MTVSIKFEIQQSEEQISLLIMRALGEAVNELLIAKKEEIKSIAQNQFLIAVANNDTVENIINGALRYEIGLTNAEAKIASIFAELANNMEVSFTPLKFRDYEFYGGLTITAVKSDYSEILGLSEANTITDKGENLPWLAWLLTGGSKILVAGYDVRFGNFGTPPSRTGQALMYRGGNWSLAIRQGEHIGRSGDNFITRAIESMVQPTRKAIHKCLKSA